MYALHPDGSVRWHADRDPDTENEEERDWLLSASRPALGAGGTIYCCYKHRLIAFQPDATIGWTHLIDRQATPIVATDGTIYVAADSCLLAFDPDGTKRWERALDGEMPLARTVNFAGRSARQVAGR